jgi:hypothetical protein
MTELTVPKRRVEVEVVLEGGPGRRVTLFLAEHSAEHAGGERLADLLERGGDFIPALDAERGAMTFLRRSAIVSATAPPESSTGDADELTLPTEHEVEVALDDGRVLRGLFSYVLPPERSRLVDYLNEERRFLPLHATGSLLLVNKRHVTRVAAVER